ncbi:MAG: hypothetical protein M0T74_13795 [Desulfitobacterium hafniense]|nr:hypothetical protein [Desulfitobacterium hafniense]
MYDLHDRVTFSKDGKNIVGKIINIYYNLEKEVMVTLRSDDQKHHIVRMADLNSCETCSHKHLHGYQKPCKECKDHSHWADVKVILFHQLNGLTPTEQSCTFKLLEEIGEVMELIGKESGASGEIVGTERDLDLISHLVMEYMDVAQSSVTAVFTLCEKHNLDLETVLDQHEKKLREKGYLVWVTTKNPVPTAEIL